MPRPRKLRCVRRQPVEAFYKPQGVPMSRLKGVVLPVEGLESIRLADAEGMEQNAAARLMDVSRPTFSRILADARRMVAEAITKGWAIRIEGGAYRIKMDRDVGLKKIDRKSEELTMEKIAVSCEGPGLDNPVESRFGRAAGFMIVDPETLEFEYLDNGSSQAMARGAGIQAAENVARSGAKVVLTGYVGPKAFQTLQAAGVRIGQNMENLTVRAAVEQYKTGQIEIAEEPNSMEHPS
ncbi:MAG: DUF134 domain-containing protein [Thermodesulfobacteriota bacterium]|nr:DUF134 domain-containing protein [Thermodesulfobacteriota bacterium]